MLSQVGAKLPFIYHILNFFVQNFSKFFKFHSTFIAFPLLADRNFAVFSFFFTHNQHVRNTLQFIITNLTSDFLITVIYYRTNIILLQEFLHFLCIIIKFLADRQNSHLLRRQPQWEFTCRMLDKHGNKAFH